MKNKRLKVVALLLSFIILSASTGCSKNDVGEDADKIDIETTTEPEIISMIGEEVLQYIHEDESFEYNIYETYAEIVWYKGLNTDVVIPDYVENVPIKVIGPFAFQVYHPVKTGLGWANGKAYGGEKIEERSDNFSITSVVLPKDLVKIGWAAFSGSALKELIIPDKVTVIENSAFSDSFLLNKIIFGNGLLEIGDFAFYDCSLQGEVVLPDSLLKIGKCAFGYNSKWWVIYNNITYYQEEYVIGKAVLKGEKTYKNKDISNAKVYSNANATIKVPDAITKIGNDAFGEVYFLKIKRGTHAVQYVYEEQFPNYEIV